MIEVATTTPSARAGRSPVLRSAPSRARYPDESGVVERDGVHVSWERYGEGSPTILLLPTWSIAHSRHWKGQIAYLARHFRVVTFDGRGNGRSDRPLVTEAYAGSAFIGDANAVLDASGTDRAVVAGLSMGGGYALQMAAVHPDRVLGAVMIGASLSTAVGPEVRPDPTFATELERYEGWDKHNAHFWRRDWAGFAQWFFEQVFIEAHSTKQIEDMVGWALETDPEVIVAAEAAPFMDPPGWLAVSPVEPVAQAFARRVTCPTLVIHGSKDIVVPPEVGRRLAAWLGAPLVVLEGSGHAPTGRDPVKVNLLIREFIESIGRTNR